MEDRLLSLGLDLGTSTTQLVLSRLTLQNSAAPFAVPKIQITEKEILYRSAVHFTPLLSERVIDGEGIRKIVAEEYQKAGIAPGDIQTGAVIITGETARKENAREILAALAGFAGDCVVATAGPDLESVLAAKGAGIPQYSKEHRCKIMHFDVGGGTSNWSIYENGALLATGCLNVGGRLVKICRETRRVSYVSPVLPPPHPAVGEEVAAEDFGRMLSSLGAQLQRVIPPDVKILSFSGGVADCMGGGETDLFAYGDLGILLGRELKTRFQNAGYTLVTGTETIRATVVGAGAHSAELSGSTVFFRDVPFPLKNLPVLALTAEETRTVPSLLAS
ncbi:MAG: ethanolamine ammonia-lyase reactivating factor EutA, partial [Oscillospiraceae bacterium]